MYNKYVGNVIKKGGNMNKKEMVELVIKQTCFYKVKVSGDDLKNDTVLENINTHPIALCENLELQDINTEIEEVA
jgi:hypothetical protein